jgi:NAD(P)-dependent dehydrogenase (short-subunit alcohol dehydrogenase family)
MPFADAAAADHQDFIGHGFCFRSSSIAEAPRGQSITGGLDHPAGVSSSHQTPDMSATTNPFDLSGKEVWVFGGAGHLGRATVELLASLGAAVLCADRHDRAEEFLRNHPLDGVTPASLDVTDSDGVREFFSAKAGLRGAPDGLVVMTYASTAKPLDELTASDFDAANHGNLTSTFLLVREAASRMAGRGSGSVVLFSSMYGSVSPDPSLYEAPMNPNPVEYGVGKAGIQQMTRYLAVHWGRSGVRVNCISPGPFPNPEVQRENPPFIERLGRKSALGRIGQAGEIGGAVAFLLSDASSYITGHNLAVDGGWTAW